jgi:hypothetical protein
LLVHKNCKVTGWNSYGKCPFGVLSVMIFHRLCETTSCILNIPVCPLHLESLQFLFLVLHLIFVSSAVLLEKSSNSFITEWVKEITMHFYPSGGRYRTLLNVLSIWYLFTVSFCEEIDAFVRNSTLPSDPLSNLNNQSFKSSGLFSSLNFWNWSSFCKVTL